MEVTRWTLGLWAIAWPVLLVLACIRGSVGSHAGPMELLLASALFRHGDRSPVDTFPKDQHKEDHWPQGFGQLSTTGMRQHYQLGQFFRNRYVGGGLITSNYTRVQVYVRSTDYDRTLMSAEAQLAGLFPPHDDQVFEPSILWQPIPVHTVPKNQDTLLRAYAVDCPRYKELREIDMNSAEYRDIENENKAFFEKVEKYTGYTPMNLDNIWGIQDTLLVEIMNNISRPDWVTDKDWDMMTELSTYSLNLMFSSTEKSRLVAGNWVRKVVSDMKTRISDSNSEMRLYLYSAHDTTVAAMATALGVYNKIMPPYAATLMIELYNDTDGENWVSLFYRNETDAGTEPRIWPLDIDSCLNTTLCTLQEFIDHTAKVIPEDWEKECGGTGSTTGNRTGNRSGQNTSEVVLGVFLALALVALLSLCVALVLTLLARRRTVKNKRLNALVNTTEESEDEIL